MVETKSETDKIQHHRRKIVFLFSAMRHFFNELEEQGYRGRYFKLDDPDNLHDFVDNAQEVFSEYQLDKIIVTEPSEYDLLMSLNASLSESKVPFEIREDNRFLITKDEFKSYADNSKTLKLEDFYRKMRLKTGYLIKDGKPEGGKWNFDHENRKSYDGKVEIPKRIQHENDCITKEVLALVQKEFPKRFGKLTNFQQAVTRKQALEDLEFFTDHCLEYFGRYQDAMVKNESLLYHSRLSHLINCGLLGIREVCEKVLSKHGIAPMASIEGFIRQIIGWREYIRGIYWLKMPEYKTANYFQAKRPLPSFYWTADCKMNCMKQVIKVTEETAYSHHIQRLMVTGNFALLCEIDPIQVHEWYLAVYDDAYEWVELPNTFGMALYADGGEMSTKPYAASGNYINKMSNFCKDCSYKVKEKTGPSACPFNYLYWNFLSKNKEKLASNHRLFMPYRNLAKKSNEDLQKVHDSASKFLEENIL